MTHDAAELEDTPPWHLGWQWRAALFEVGREYIVWPQDPALKQKRGRRCVFLGFEPARRGPGLDARVHYLDDRQADVVALADLIPAYHGGNGSEEGSGR